MDRFPSWYRLLIAILIVWTYTGAGNALNDYCDADIDRINRPQRPIPQGLVSRRAALAISIGLFVFGSLLALPLLTLPIAVIMLFAMMLLISYSTTFKVLPFWGNVVVSLILGMAFLFGASVFGDIQRGIPPFLLAFGFNLIREVVKDMQDIDGDRTVGARTVPLRYGIDTARRLVILLTLLLMIGALLPCLLNIYGRLYLVTLIVAVELPLLYVILSIQHDASSRNCARLAALLKGDVFFGLLAIYLGKF